MRVRECMNYESMSENATLNCSAVPKATLQHAHAVYRQPAYRFNLCSAPCGVTQHTGTDFYDKELGKDTKHHFITYYLSLKCLTLK